MQVLQLELINKIKIKLVCFCEDLGYFDYFL